MVAPAIAIPAWWGARWVAQRGATYVAKRIAQRAAKRALAKAAAEAARKAAEEAEAETCQDCEGKCPVCGQKGGKPPKEEPQWSKDKNTPPSSNTILGDKGSFKKMGGKRHFHGNSAYIEKGTGNIHYIDGLHGNGQGQAEIEVFDPKSKKHLGTKCPACGADLGPPDPKKRLPEQFR
jgi:hypothetical protein